MAQFAFIDTTTPQCISGSGQATVAPFTHLGWTTPNGSTAIIVVINPSLSNQLSFVISGAPVDIVATDGSLLNGLHDIPPNTPTANITAIGNFRGQQVMLFNVSNPAADAQVTTSTPSPC